MKRAIAILFAVVICNPVRADIEGDIARTECHSSDVLTMLFFDGLLAYIDSASMHGGNAVARCKLTGRPLTILDPGWSCLGNATQRAWESWLLVLDARDVVRRAESNRDAADLAADAETAAACHRAYLADCLSALAKYKSAQDKIKSGLLECDTATACFEKVIAKP